MKEIRLSNLGITVKVDDSDYILLNQYTWYGKKSSGRIYAGTNIKYNGKYKSVKMHSFLMGKAPDGFTWDHRDRDGLNNQRNNLRLATPVQQSQNTKLRKGSSQYRGVSWDKSKLKWNSQIYVNGKAIKLGCFYSELMAANAYDEAAKKYHDPEFRVLNIVQEKNA